MLIRQCRGNATPTRGHSAATCNRVTSGAAALEWTVSFIVVFYFLTLVADLWPAGKSSPRYMRRLARWQERNGDGDNFTGRRAFDEYPDRWQGSAAEREERMRQEMHARNLGMAAPTYPATNGGYAQSQMQGYESGRPSEAGSHAPMMRQV
jgi:hypothetical protein